LAGNEILFHGEWTRIKANAGTSGLVQFASESVRASDCTGDLRPVIEKHLRVLAGKELPARTLEFAACHRLSV
jgi:hypothetical protein